MTAPLAPQPRLRRWVVPVAVVLGLCLLVVVVALPGLVARLSLPSWRSDGADTAPTTPVVLPDTYREPTTTYGAKPVPALTPEPAAPVQASTLTMPPPPAALLPQTQPGRQTMSTANIPTALLQPAPGQPGATAQAQRPLMPGERQPSYPVPQGQGAGPKRWGIDLTHTQQQRRQPSAKEREEAGRAEAAKSLITPAIWSKPQYPLVTIYKSQTLAGRLINSLSSDVPGIAKIELTIPLYDKFGQGQMILDKGTIIIAKQAERPEYGQTRLPVTIDQLELVGGEVLKVKAVGQDAEGKTGLVDRVNNHYGKLALAVGINAILSLGVNSLAGTPSGFYASPTQQAAREATQSASEDIRSITKQQLKVPPTIEIRAGTICQIQLDENIMLSRKPYVAK